MKCLVLGGAGFIGSNIARALLLRGHSVRVLDRATGGSGPRIEIPGLEFLTGDFLNERELADALTGMDAVIHLACPTIPQSSNDNPIYDVESNVVGTLRLLALSRESGVRKTYFLHPAAPFTESPPFSLFPRPTPRTPFVPMASPSWPSKSIFIFFTIFTE